MARYTVKQLARLSGVSVRTLHYYDGIGLFSPADVGANGYHYYGRAELLRLQQILFYKELGLPLAEIKRTIDDPGFDLTEALRAHRGRLVADIERYRRLIQTIDKTIDGLNGKSDMTMPNPFEGFAPERQQAYENELIEAFGGQMRERIAQSHRRAAKMSPDEHEAIKREAHAVNLGLVERIKAGDGPDTAEVQALIKRHHGWVSHYWSPDKEGYEGLAGTYVSHPDFRAFYDGYDMRLVDFLAKAMTIHASRHLA